MKSPLLRTALTLLASTSMAFAWDTPGHEQIADMAYPLLGDSAKARIREILAHGDARYRPVDSSDNALRDAFLRAASFPDVLRNPGTSSTYDDTFVDAMNLKFQPDLTPAMIAQNPEYVRCKTWHYCDTPIHYTGPKPELYPSNGLAAMNYATQQLSLLKNSNAADDLVKAGWWLYWIEHLTGDLHQPLHCTSNYQHQNKSDNGGNGMHITVPRDDDPSKTHSVKLHSYWDEGIDHAAGGIHPPTQDLASADAKAITDTWLADTKLTPDANSVADLDVAHWIARGAELAAASVYQETDDAGQTKQLANNETVIPKYTRDQIDLCKHQAVLAAHRLAAVLNKIFQP